MEELSIKGFVKKMSKDNSIQISSMAENLGINQGSLSGMLMRNTMKITRLIEIMEICDQDLVIELKNGEKIKLKKDE